MPKRLRISRTPTGAAPEHVRRAWVGLELLGGRGPSSRVEAWWWVITGRAKRSRGSSVAVLDALAVLEAARPLEAAWQPLENFVFDAACGEVVE